MSEDKSLTPLMQQYMAIKKIYQEEVVFFQVGDFYELFFSDAKTSASILGITLTKRGFYMGEHIPLCGVPVHMIDHYIPKLIKKGYIVVICNQTEVAQVGKLVERAVAEIITPSTFLSNETTDKVYSLFVIINAEYILSFWFEFGYQEIIYHNCQNTVEGITEFRSLFESYQPKEIITNVSSIELLYSLIPGKCDIKTIKEDGTININLFMAKYQLDTQYSILVCLFLSYLKKYFESMIVHNSFVLKKITVKNHLFLDNATIKYLECVSNLQDGTKKNTLYGLIDKTRTKMGARLLKDWILSPLCDQESICKRQCSIDLFFKMNSIDREEIHDLIGSFGDLERFFHRLRLNKVKDKDLVYLLHFQKKYEEFGNVMSQKKYHWIANMINMVIPSYILNMIHNNIIDDNSIVIDDEIHYINPKGDLNLFSLYEGFFDQERALIQFCEKEKQKTGIDELVIKKTPLYNFVFELSKVKDKKYEIPEYYKRVQTLAHKERYISDSLQEFSYHLLHAQENYIVAEKKIKNNLINEILKNANSIFEFIDSLKLVDVYISLALCAYQYGWQKPMIVSAGEGLFIEEGKHPITSSMSSSYIANSLYLKKQTKGMMITGPNMGGKSTYMKQNALIVLLSHIGSFVPAKSASIPLMEKMLTRVGASDSLIEGKSTFFLELEELNTILHSSNKFSFIIIDEIGRGTSTHDGMALAASIILYLIRYKNPYLLCSTHYHELKDIIKDRLEWFYMNFVILPEEGIKFLYQIKEGCSQSSMGILLAKQIGFPEEIIKQSQLYFNELKYDITENQYIKSDISECSYNCQLIKSVLENIDFDNITPRQAYDILDKIKKDIKI